MTRIAILTDSDSSLSADFAARHAIRLVPIGINFGEETFEAGVNIDDRELFRRVDRLNKLPTTSAPSAGNFKAAFEAAFHDGFDSLVCLCVSSEVSATYNAALNARELFPERDIAVIDSRNLSLGQGFMAAAAAEAAARGESKEQVIAAALELGGRVKYYGALATLKYLAMSGRVGYLAAGMASLIDLKPILTIRGGKLEMLEKIRTRKKALERLIELAQADSGGRAVERMALLHVNALEEARKFEQQLRAAVPCPAEIDYFELGPGLSVHTGAGLIAVAFVLAQE
jgi:DegV family protein with EDD domain